MANKTKAKPNATASAAFNPLHAVTTDTHNFDLSQFSAEEILSAIYEDGKVDEDGVRIIMKKKLIEKLLSNHEHKIWKGDDGRWRTYLPDPDKPKGRKLVSRATEEDLKELLCDYYRNIEEELKRKNMTLESLFEEWTKQKGKHCSESTIARNKATWKSLYEGEPIIEVPICKLTTEMIADWIDEKISLKKMNQHQYNTFSSVIRQMLDYAKTLGIITVNPLDSIKISRRDLRPEPKKSSETQVFFPEERDMLIKHALDQYKIGRNTEQRFVPLAIAFLLSVSLRRGEVTALKFEDLHGRKLTLARAFSHGADKIEERLKDADGWREVFVTPSALDIIEQVRSERLRLGMPVDGYIFVVNERHQSFYSSLGKMINNYCDELNIPRRNLHSTRRTCASMMHAANVSDLTIQAQLGHKDLRTTQNSYCYDLTKENERYELISQALA